MRGLFQSDLNIVVSFDRRGEYIYTGNAKGRVSQQLSAAALISCCYQLTAEILKFRIRH